MPEGRHGREKGRPLSRSKDAPHEVGKRTERSEERETRKMKMRGSNQSSSRGESAERSEKTETSPKLMRGSKHEMIPFQNGGMLPKGLGP